MAEEHKFLRSRCTVHHNSLIFTKTKLMLIVIQSSCTLLHDQCGNVNSNRTPRTQAVLTAVLSLQQTKNSGDDSSNVEDPSME